MPIFTVCLRQRERKSNGGWKKSLAVLLGLPTGEAIMSGHESFQRAPPNLRICLHYVRQVTVGRLASLSDVVLPPFPFAILGQLRIQKVRPILHHFGPGLKVFGVVVRGLDRVPLDGFA